MPLLNEKVSAETREILRALRDPLRLTCFTQAGCDGCGHVEALAGELAALSPLVKIEVKDFAAAPQEAARLGVSRVPALALAREGEARAPVRYYGLPAGQEFGAFLSVLVALSTGRAAAGVDAAAVAPIVRPSRLMVFVLPDCPRCPEMAYRCASLGIASPLVETDIVDANAFPALAKRFTVGVVPKVIVNETLELLDVVAVPELIAQVAAAAPA
jgi:alkyl hydroperoxide reductase subunit AhpF